MSKLSKFLSFDDLMEIKKVISQLSKEGKFLITRKEHMEMRAKASKQKYASKGNPLP